MGRRPQVWYSPALRKPSGSPTGVAMSPARRARLLDRAGAEGFAVIEDDYEFEMSFAGAPSPALKAIDRAGFVTISTGLRACLADPEHNPMDAAKLEKLFLSLA